MSSHRHQTEEALLVRFAALYIAREANRNTLITPTRAQLSASRTKAVIYVSIFPDATEEKALAFLRRRQHDFFVYLNKEARFSIVPGIRFELDLGEKNRQHLDEISREV